MNYSMKNSKRSPFICIEYLMWISFFVLFHRLFMKRFLCTFARDAREKMIGIKWVQMI